MLLTQDVKEIKDYQNNRKNLTIGQLELILKKNKIVIPKDFKSNFLRDNIVKPVTKIKSNLIEFKENRIKDKNKFIRKAENFKYDSNRKITRTFKDIWKQLGQVGLNFLNIIPKLGKVIYELELEDIDVSKGQWMILTRTNDQMKKLVPTLQETGYRFDCKFNDLLPLEVIKAINDWNRLNKGASISGDEARNIYEYLKYDKGDVKYGFSGGKSLVNIDSVDMDELRMDHGLIASGDWTALRFKDYQHDYIKELVASGEDLSKPARIKLSTIHAVKGEEAENVILFTDLERIIYESAQVNKDTEHRLFFVGVTRAKENLFIMNQGYEYQYNIGEEII